MDDDLQNPPEEIAILLAKLTEGYSRCTVLPRASSTVYGVI